MVINFTFMFSYVQLHTRIYQKDLKTWLKPRFLLYIISPCPVYFIIYLQMYYFIMMKLHYMNMRMTHFQ